MKIGAGQTVSLANLTMTGGVDDHDENLTGGAVSTVSLNGGGAIFNNGGTLTLASVVFSNNAANNPIGGAIATTGGSLEMTNVTFAGNAAGVAGAVAHSLGHGGRHRRDLQRQLRRVRRRQHLHRRRLAEPDELDDRRERRPERLRHRRPQRRRRRVAHERHDRAQPGLCAFDGRGREHDDQEHAHRRRAAAATAGQAGQNDSVTDTRTAAAVTGDGGDNLDQNGDCGLSASNGNLTGDPLLTSLGNFGGPTETDAILTGSPAIHAGSGCAPIDQRGYHPSGSCDIGAFDTSPARRRRSPTRPAIRSTAAATTAGS